MKKRRVKFAKLTDISASALREFAELRRIANKAVQKALRENRKLGIKGAHTER